MFVGHLRVRQVHLISHATSRVLFHGRTALTAATMPTRQHWRMLLLLLSACTQYLSCIQAVAVQLLDGLIDRNLPERLPTPVIFDHDAGIDDFITLMLLLSQPQHVKLLGVTIIEGDCLADVAVNTTLKMLHVLGQHDIPIALSTLQAVNAFPLHYRAQTLGMDVLPMLNHHDPADIDALRRRLLQTIPGQEYLAQLLLRQVEPVTVIMTGPLSNLAYALDKYPETAAKISRVWWMGGALKVPGNVHQNNSDGSAEWNAFWDPAAMGVVWNSSVPLTMVPLDGTNKVPITPDLLYSFGPQASYLYSNLAGTLYAPVANWVFHQGTIDVYYAWDVLTAACMLKGSELCHIEHDLPVAAVLDGPGQGATVLVNQTQQLLQRLETAEQSASREVLQKTDLGVSSASPGAALAAAEAIARAAAKQGMHAVDRRGLEVSGQLSGVKTLSAVMDVDLQKFKKLVLDAFRR